MSTKSHVELNLSLEIYHETSEPIYSFGKFRGYNIFFIATDILEFKITNDYLKIFFDKESDAAKFFAYSEFKIWLHSLNEIEYNIRDNELMFVIKGDSLEQDNFNKKDFTKYNNKLKL